MSDHRRDSGVPTFTGPVFRPGDAGYEAEIAGFQTDYTHRPSLVVGAADAEDVRLAVAFAAERGLPVAVQATGHGLSVATDGGVLITTGRMTGVHVDPVSRTVRFEAGARWRDVIEAATPHGLAPLNGSSPGVGAVGYTLGGGLGVLARQFGWAADHVLALEVVTADGRAHWVEPGDELFGGLLGSGGNLGVVTAMEAELFDVPEVFGGTLTYGEPLIQPALETWSGWAATAPEAMTSSVTLIGMPDIPQMPEPLRGRYVASFRFAFSGSAAEGDRLVAPLRAIGEPLRDDLRTLPYGETGSIHNEPDWPHAYAATNALISGLTPEGIAALLELGGPKSPVPCIIDIRQLGGALRAPGRAGTAIDFRDAAFVVRVISMRGPDTPAEEIRDRHTLLRKALEPWTLGHNLAFLYGDGDNADEAQTRAGYTPETYARLRDLKTRYDPDNMFRFNRNIPAREH